MDILTLALAKEYTDSQRVAYAEPGETFIYDGNSNDLITIGNLSYARFYGIKYDFTTLEKIVIKFADGSESEITEFAVSDTNLDGVPAQTVSASFMGMTGMVAATLTTANDSALVIISLSDVYVSRLEFAETIHPIDPKYLPGAVLPVVEITSALGWTDTQTETALNDADNATLTSTAQTSRNFICAVPVMGMKLFMNLQLMDRGGADGSGYAYLGSASIMGASGFHIFLNSDDGKTWSAATLLTA